MFACAKGPVAAAAFLVLAAALPSTAGEPFLLSETIGPEIDAAERDLYSLFPDLPGYRSGRLIREANGRVVFEYEVEDRGRIRTGRRTVPEESLALTLRHVANVEAYQRARAEGEADLEARILHRMALRYALDTRYDLAIPLLEELERSYPEQGRDLGGPELLDDARRLSGSRRVLFKPGSLIDRSGRADVLIFAGYYGVWLGLAVPIAADADTPQEFSLGLLTLPAVSLVTAHYATRNRSVTDADAALVSLGGHLGTWQGLGWASLGEEPDEGRGILTAGIVTGLAGIAAGTALVHDTDFSEGHVALMEAGMSWGAWLGLLAASLADAESDGTLQTMLVGSDALVLAAAVGGQRTEVTKRQVRLMNLGGVIGGIIGGGLILLAEVEDGKGAAAILGVGSIAGALAALGSSAQR